MVFLLLHVKLSRGLKWNFSNKTVAAVVVTNMRMVLLLEERLVLSMACIRD